MHHYFCAYRSSINQFPWRSGRTCRASRALAAGAAGRPTNPGVGYRRFSAAAACIPGRGRRIRCRTLGRWCCIALPLTGGSKRTMPGETICRYRGFARLATTALSGASTDPVPVPLDSQSAQAARDSRAVPRRADTEPGDGQRHQRQPPEQPPETYAGVGLKLSQLGKFATQRGIVFF